MVSDMGNRPLNLLLIEDSAEDSELLVHHLKKAGMRIACRRVETAEAMAQALESASWDLVLSDYALPSFSGLEALRLLQASGLDLPFILVSGTIGEEIAVTTLKAGANDFVTKGRLSRLVPAINRELREAEVRRSRRAAESALRETQEKLTAIGEAASDAILLMDPEFRVSFWNPAAERMFGYPADYALGRDALDLILAPGQEEILRHRVQESLPQSDTPATGRTIELIGKNKEGWEIELEASLSGVLLEGRWHAVAILRDVTHRKSMEQEWREQLHFFQTMLETIPNPVYYKDAEGCYLGCNRAFAAFVDMPAEDVVGRTALDFAPEDHWQEHMHAEQEVIRTRQSKTYETEVQKGDGEPRTVIISKAPYFDIDGHVAGTVGTMLDITERRRNELEKAKLEIQLRQAQKLEAIGQLAAGIAHEINTPTQYIGDNTSFLRDTFKDIIAFLKWQQEALRSLVEYDALSRIREEWTNRSRDLDLAYLLEEIPKAITQTMDGVARVSRIVGAMKDFSHPGMESQVHVDLNHAIESTLIISHNEWKYIAEVEPDYDPALPAVPCFPSEFNQVVLNLVVNAAHAIQEARERGNPELKGLIRISTRHEGNDVVVRIADNGTGIPEAIRQKIFEPFFTTKPIGKGTGQGLAIAHSVIVDKHKGRITVESEPGKGTTFIITLPVEDQDLVAKRIPL